MENGVIQNIILIEEKTKKKGRLRL
jgi:hypothetical protein